MKHRIRKTLSLVLALLMLLSMVPLVYAAEDVDEFAGLETLEEIPFEFVLEPGDLPYELLREAVLDVRDIPDCIDPALAEERGHVNRLYLQEPDDNTVMFQNRDGSKTIYLFSHPVKGMTASTVATVQINGTSVSFSGENAITSRLAEITNFNIGSAEIDYLPVGVLSENGVMRIELLPYNKMTGSKYPLAGLKYRPSFDESRKLRVGAEIFEEYGISAVLI